MFVEVPRLQAEVIVIYPSDHKNEQNCFTSRDTHQLIPTGILADIVSLLSGILCLLSDILSDIYSDIGSEL